MITRRNFIKAVGAAAVLASVPEGIVNAAQGGTKMTKAHPVAGTDGDHYIPFDERTGEASVVYFTRDLSAAGLAKMYDRIAGALTGKIGVKLHTGEPHGPNIIPRPWVRELLASRLPDATIVETNTYYQGGRYTTEQHRKTIATNGWTFAPVDIMDEDGTTMMPVKGGKWFTEMSVGDHMPGYDSLLILTHFKGHTMGGFGGSNKKHGAAAARAARRAFPRPHRHRGHAAGVQAHAGARQPRRHGADDRAHRAAGLGQNHPDPSPARRRRARSHRAPLLRAAGRPARRDCRILPPRLLLCGKNAHEPRRHPDVPHGRAPRERPHGRGRAGIRL